MLDGKVEDDGQSWQKVNMFDHKINTHHVTGEAVMNSSIIFIKIVVEMVTKNGREENEKRVIVVDKQDLVGEEGVGIKEE